MLILFVCTGNTCRSPMAEAMARALLAENNKDWVRVESRGLFVERPEPPSEFARLVLAEHYGLDISGHVSRQLTREDLEAADLVVTMTAAHRAAIRQVRPEGVLTLKELAGQSGDIYDPYGGSYGDYLRCAEEIYKCLRPLPFLFAVD